MGWVAQGNEHPMLKLIEEISYKTLYPIKNVIPAMGGGWIDLFGNTNSIFTVFIGGLIQSFGMKITTKNRI